MAEQNSDVSFPPQPPKSADNVPRIQLQTDDGPQLAGSTIDTPEVWSEKDEEVSKPRIVFKDGEIEGKSYNETKIDVVLVPCPGADPFDSWRRTRLDIPGMDVFGEEIHMGENQEVNGVEVASIFEQIAYGLPLNPGMNTGAKSAISWPRILIKKEVNFARILGYDHGRVMETQGLKSLAERLLQLVKDETGPNSGDRPLFFICHSIGGLVVKLALTMASRDTRYRSLLENCHGVTFFATPHRGSSYLSGGEFTASMRALLELSAPLPARLLNELRLEDPALLRMHEDFKTLAGEMKIWSFYETGDSLISGRGAPGSKGGIPFKAPIVSMRSAILDIRHERIYALRATHATCASFGMPNFHTMRLFLDEFGKAVKKADAINRRTKHVGLRLESMVKVEVHGFYEVFAAPGVDSEWSIRPFSTERPLKSFFKEGPDEIVKKRLKTTRQEREPDDSDFLRNKHRASSLLPPGAQATNSNDRKSRKGSISFSRSSKNASYTKSTRGDFNVTAPARLMGTSVETSPSIAVPLAPPTPVAPQSNPAPDESGIFLKVSRSRSESSLATLPNRAGHVHPKDSEHLPERSGSETYLGLPEATDTSPGKGSTNSPTFLGDDEVMMVPTRRPSVTQPDMNNRKFIWVHLPFNNPSWVRKVFDTLGVTGRKDFSEVFNAENWSTKHTRGRHSQHHGCFLKSSCGYMPARPKRSFTMPPKSLSDQPPAQGCLYLYMPFLHFDTYKMLIQRRNMIKRRTEQGRTRPVPLDVANDASLEIRVIWEFLGHDPPVNCRRTLDQYRYPSLHDTRARDDDQMLYKMTKEGVLSGADMNDQTAYPVSARAAPGRRSYNASGQETDGEDNDDNDREADTGEDEADKNLGGEGAPGRLHDVLDGNVLMVDQLWLWVIDATTLVTFFPRREGDPMEGPLHDQADLRDSIFSEVNADLTRRCENALDLAALTVLHAVSVLIDRSSHPDLEIFRIFEEAISILTEKMTSSLKTFRTSGLRRWDGDDTELKTSSIRARHKREDERAEQENRDNTSALLELRDIEDELSTLKHLFEDQEEQVTTMLAVYVSGSSTNAGSRRESSSWLPSASSPPVGLNGSMSPSTSGGSLTANGRGFLQEALAKLKSYQGQAEDMIRRVEKTRQDFDKLLETIQRQAQIDEVRLSRQQADLASAQERSVMIFTVFTVIFLPLSFFTGIFGMNTLEWGGDDNLSLRTIGAIALPSSAALIGVALVVAWSTSVRKGLKYSRRGLARCKNRSRRWCEAQMEAFWRESVGDAPATPGRGKARERDESLLSRKQRKELMKNKMAQDFWERHRIERELGYEIPRANRKDARVAKTRGRVKRAG